MSENFFRSIEEQLHRMIENGNKYYYLIDVQLPCSPDELGKRFSQYSPEIRKCKGCSTPKFDIIFTLPLTRL